MISTPGSVDGYYLYNRRTGESVWPANTKLILVDSILAKQLRKVLVVTGKKQLQSEQRYHKSKVCDRESHLGGRSAARHAVPDARPYSLIEGLGFRVQILS